MLKISLILLNLLILINARENDLNTTEKLTNHSSLIEHRVEHGTKATNHTKRHRVGVKNLIKESNKLQTDLLEDHEKRINISLNESILENNNIVTERASIIHVNLTTMKAIENSSLPIRLEGSSVSRLNNTVAFLKDEYESMTPAWLVGLAIIGFVLAIFLIACFVSIGFSMVDVSSMNIII